jgi:hypothetical protein
MAFRSEGGLNCKFQLSNPSAADSLHKVVEALRRTTVELSKSVTYINNAKHSPTIAFLSCAVIFGLGQLALLQKGILLRNPGDAYRASALRVEQTFVGSWSEAPCDPRSKPDIFINSRRATSSAGGICEFSNVRPAGSGWTVGTACSNVGEKWTATIHLTVSGGKLVWTGRDGTETQYFRCR